MTDDVHLSLNYPLVPEVLPNVRIVFINNVQKCLVDRGYLCITYLFYLKHYICSTFCSKIRRNIYRRLNNIGWTCVVSSDYFTGRNASFYVYK